MVCFLSKQTSEITQKFSNTLKQTLKHSHIISDCCADPTAEVTMVSPPMDKVEAPVDMAAPRPPPLAVAEPLSEPPAYATNDDGTLEVTTLSTRTE